MEYFQDSGVYDVLSLGGFGLLAVNLLLMGYISTCREQFGYSRGLLILSAIYLVVIMTLAPTGDKIRYVYAFDDYYETGLNLESAKDAGFAVFTYLLGNIVQGNALLYFLIIASIYVGGAMFFARKCFPDKDVPLCASIFSSFGFWSYGTNTLRSGLALSLLLVALAYVILYGKKRWITILVIGAISLSFHVSMLVPIAAIVLGYFFHRPRLFLIGWFLCLLISLAFGDQIQSAVGVYFEDSEERRISSYLLGDSSGYNMGFRWDFLLFSICPIFLSFFYKFCWKVNDRFYDIVVCAYLAANGFWLLLIRAPYSDRIAYLSWFLMPLLLLLPFLRWEKVVAKNSKILLTLMGQFGFLIFMMIYHNLQQGN